MDLKSMFIPFSYLPTVPGASLLLEVQDNVIPSLTMGVEVNTSYTYISSIGVLEANEPIYAESVEVTGTLEIGDILTATLVGLYIPNGSSAGSHIYEWYRCSNTKSNGVLIAGATASTYELVSLDNGKFIRCVVTPVQTSGGNLQGTPLKSLFLGRVSGALFNPVVDINWDTAFVHDDLVEYDTTDIWVNSGTGADAIQYLATNIPVYNPTFEALEFTRPTISPYTPNQKLEIKNQSQAQPFVVWIKFRLKTLSGSQYLVGWTNSTFLAVLSTGNLSVCGGIAATGFLIDTDYVLRVVVNGINTTVEVNNGTPIAITSGVATSGLGSSTGYLGASKSLADATHLNGFIYDYFISNDETIDAGKEDDMWTSLI